jgi:hypothetical protein
MLEVCRREFLFLDDFLFGDLVRKMCAIWISDWSTIE